MPRGCDLMPADDNRLLNNIDGSITQRNPMNIDLRDLRYFEIIAEQSHLGRAATLLHRSQPALTKCIRRIEEDLGAPVFDRTGRSLTLTVVGKELYTRAKKVREACERHLGDMRELAKGNVGKVRLGCGPITADYLLPTICSLISREAPGISLEIVVNTNYVLKEQMSEGKLDLIVGALSNDQRLISRGILQDTVVVAASSEHPIFQRHAFGLADLLEYQWILPSRQVASRIWLDQVFQSRELPPPEAYIETNVLPNLHDVIARTNSLSFLSKLAITHPKARGLLHEVSLPETTMERQLGITYPRQDVSPACTTVISLLSSHALNEELSDQ